MSGQYRKLFRPGQLVKALDWIDNGIGLLNTPYVHIDDADDRSREIGFLAIGAIAVIVATGRFDGAYLYVLGPTGGGWAPSAFLTIVQEPTGKPATVI